MNVCLNEDSDSVTDGFSLSPYLRLSAVPGHFVLLPEEKGYTADRLQCNQTWRHSLELREPSGLLQLRPAKRQLDTGEGSRNADASERSRSGRWRKASQKL